MKPRQKYGMLIYGGGQPEGLGKRFFLEPAIFANENTKSTLAG
jgi:hypothetical protein